MNLLGRSVGAALAVIASPLVRAADQRPTFKSEVQLVAINAVVTDKRGRTVTNLNEDAFQISEDNRPQRISHFTRDPLPLSIAVALDTSGSMHGERFEYARQAILRLLDRLGPKDEVTIYGFNNRPYPIIPWTQSRDAAAKALADEQPMAGGFTALFDAVRVGLQGLDAATARRRALLIISDGNDELPDDRWHGTGITRPINLTALERRSSVVADVTRSEGVVYAIGISDPRRFEQALDEEALRALVNPTGGVAATVHANEDIPGAVEGVLADLRDQYLIGFVPTHPPDGKFHKLKVTVRGCDCHVRARAGFVYSH